MRRLLMLFLLLALLTMGANDFDPVPTGMVGYWRFEENSGGAGATTADGSGYGHSLILGNALGSAPPSWTGTHWEGSYALSFDLTSGPDVLYIASASLDQDEFPGEADTPFSITVAANASSLSAGTTGCLASKYRTADGDRSWYLAVNNTGGTITLQFVKGYDDGGTGEFETKTLTLAGWSTGTWYSYAATLAANGAYTLRVTDGVTTWSGNGTFTNAGVIATSASTDFVVGSRETTTNNVYDIGWGGVIDEVTIWKTALSAANIAAIQAQTYPPASSGPTDIQRWWARRRQ